MGKPLAGKCSPEVWLGILFSFILCFFLLPFDYPSNFLGVNNGVSLFENKETHPIGIVKNQSISVINQSTTDSCSGRYIYIHDDLPTKFNYDLINNCESLTGSNMPNMCPHIKNFGFGQEINNSEGVLTNKRWFSTNQFSLELIFHSKMKHYECLTNNSAQASAIYIPIYPGLEESQHLWDPNLTARDSFGEEFSKWVSSRFEWKKMWGRDHFFVSGRVAFDYRRKTDNISDWGSTLRVSPESNNMTMLTIEGSSRTNDIAIPYPTGFHPAKDSEVFQWQNRVRGQERPYLFTFVGGPRPDQPNSIRGKLFDQCQASSTCKVLNCHSSGINCEETVTVMRVFQKSVYCLHPTGDTFTRKSAFDSILAGCIPVFFHPASAYNQYLWYLPKNYTKYSVFIPVRKAQNLKDGSIEKILLEISKDMEFAMREQVISLIPKLVYGDPRSRLETKDAFDIAVNKILERIENVRKVVREGRDPSIGFAEPDGNKFLFPEELE
ncbi:putative exostosin [Rosa chinensis]|uniref:Putative exostosin n=1 Tax=Rosa chinensis TaxID=74649 RepID=A0A2P6QW60_ROSCH|nr:probable xyloglucan galactosyltransferase GT14 [Rosa chinensis]PRQ38394.1 putative exostosin [Rosa chinensis]